VEHFQLDRQPYIALVRRVDVKTGPDDPVQLAIYAPGTVCLYWPDHEQGAASFNYGFLVWVQRLWSRDCWGLVGPDCLKVRCAGFDPQPWRTALNQRHPLAGTGLGIDWRNQTRREYWRLVPLMGMILQVEPDRGTLRGYLKRATTMGKRPFTPPDERTLYKILRERGSQMHIVKPTQEARNRELKAHFGIIKRRRDLAFRLARLAALNLDTDDRAKVESLQAFNTQWRNGRMMSLTENQVRLVGALEAKYFEQRKEAAEALAQALAREFGLVPPWQ